MYKILNEPVETDKIWPWCQIIPNNFSIFGFSWVGDFFLVNEFGTEFGVLLTHSAEIELVPVVNREQFEYKFLGDRKIREAVLRETDVEILKERIGALSENETYFPVPYPWLGGTGELDTYEKGDVWVYASSAGQSHGLGAA